MGLLGNGWNDPQSSANLALAAGLLRGDMGAGLLGSSNAYSEAQNNAIKQKLAQAQLENYASEVETRKAALAKQQQLLGMLGMLNGEQSQPAQMGQLGSGSFGVVPPPAGMPAIPSSAPQSGGSRIGSMSPDQLAAMKLLGVDMADIYKIARPDMQVSNGYAYDKNTLKPGFLPQANVSQNGQATVMTVGQDGMPRISTPNGAIESYSAFRQADEAAKAGQDLVKVTAPDGSERYVTRSQAVQAAQPRPTPQPLPQGSPTGNYVGDPQVVLAAINDIKDPTERARAKQAYEQQYGPLQASPTTAQAAGAAAAKVTAEQTAKDVAEQRKAIMNADFSAPTNIAKYQQIGKLLADVDGGKLTPRGVELASALNSIGIKVDKNLPNKEAAMSLANEAALQLRNPNGGAGMPGAMSDQDRQFLASMTPNIAQSAQGRKQVIDAYVAVQRRNQQIAQFARNYEKKYGRLDNGFFDQLQAWSNSNPLFGGK